MRTIQIKLLSFILILGIGFISGLTFLRAFERHKLLLLARSRTNEQRTLLHITTEAMGKNEESFVADYSLWDEMIVFVRNRSVKWSSINLDPGLSNFNLQAIWVFSSKFGPIYFKTDAGLGASEAVPTNSAAFRQKLKKEPFCHFFGSTSKGIIEIFGAPIQPSNDSLRKAEPSGYLFSGRLLSRKYLNQLGSLSSSYIYLSSDAPEQNRDKDAETMSNSIGLADWQGRICARLVIKKAYPLYEHLAKMTDLQVYVSIFFILLVLIFSSIFVHFALNRPIKILSKCLKDEDPEPVKALKRRKDEFGQLAFLMGQFFSQNNALLREIEDRKEAEKELCSIKDNLEKLVERRTIKLTETSRRLKRDIAERETAEQELIKSNERFFKAFFTSPDSININRLEDGLYLEINEGFSALTGYDKEYVVGKTSLDIQIWANPEDRNRLSVLLKRKGKVNNFEAKFRTSSGTIKTGLMSASLIKVENELAIISITRDITERKEMEIELNKAKEKAENSDRLKSEFLAQMSHEIRSPINTILNYVSLIKEEVRNPEDRDTVSCFQAIDSSSRRLIRTIDMILNMSQIQCGYYDCKFQSIDLETDVIKNIQREFMSSAQLKGLSLNLYNHACDSRIQGDLYSVNQIFANLVGNAIKYTDAGSVNVRIYNDQSGSLDIDVEDTGIGISENYITNLFIPFSQEEQGYTRKFDGNGLGLALVKKYCEINGARISVKSKKGEGSTFSVRFPKSNAILAQKYASVHRNN